MAKVGNVSEEHLRQYITRIERLEEEKSCIAVDIREAYAEAKANGFDTVALREIIKLRKLSKEELEEREQLLDTYKGALGMIQTSFDFGEEKPKNPVSFTRQTDIEEFTGRPEAA